MKFKRLAAMAVGFAILSGCSSVPISKPQPKTIDLIIGTYSMDGSEGVYSAQFDLVTGEISPPKLALKSTHATFLTVHNSGVIYGATRNSGGRLTAFRPAGEKGFAEINHVSTQSESPCYVSISPDGNYLASANYSGGAISLLPIGEGGMVVDKVQVKQHYGNGPHKRQKAPHAHWVQWSPYNSGHIYATDLGIDQVKLYPFDAATGEAGDAKVAFQSPSGEGPRHLVFHPTKKIAYIIHELASKVHAVKVKDDGTFEAFTSADTRPEGYKGENNGAHIAISSNGKYLYTSNRGLNTIAIFDIDAAGAIKLRENVSTGGNWPRYFKLFDQYGYMLVANRHTHDISVFKVEADGGLTPTGKKASVPHPTFVDEYKR